MTLPGEDGHEEEASDALTPGIEGMETPEQAPAQEDKEETITSEPHAQESSTTVLPDRLDWILPEGSDTNDTDGRTGVLSTYVEWHALVLGLSAGAIAAQSGRLDEIVTIIGAGAAGSRAQLGLPDKYRDQARKELPYFIAGVILGIGAARSDMLVDIPLGA